MNESKLFIKELCFINKLIMNLTVKVESCRNQKGTKIVALIAINKFYRAVFAEIVVCAHFTYFLTVDYKFHNLLLI